MGNKAKIIDFKVIPESGEIAESVYALYDDGTLCVMEWKQRTNDRVPGKWFNITPIKENIK